jgi:hypothetical protein
VSTIELTARFVTCDKPDSGLVTRMIPLNRPESGQLVRAPRGQCRQVREMFTMDWPISLIGVLISGTARYGP